MSDILFKILRDRIAKRLAAKELSEAPCDQCGYNGEGYYQIITHPCVKGHLENLALSQSTGRDSLVWVLNLINN